jgi:hypothetical protein
MMRRLGPIALGLAVLGCGEDGPAAEVTARITDVRAANGESTMTFSVRNGTAAPIVLEGCPFAPSFALERREAGEWDVRSEPGPCTEMTWQQVELQPDEVLSAAFATDYAGRVRVRVFFGASAEAAYASSAVTQARTLSP